MLSDVQSVQVEVFDDRLFVLSTHGSSISIASQAGLNRRGSHSNGLTPIRRRNASETCNKDAPPMYTDVVQAHVDAACSLLVCKLEQTQTKQTIQNIFMQHKQHAQIVVVGNQPMCCGCTTMRSLGLLPSEWLLRYRSATRSVRVHIQR